MKNALLSLFYFISLISLWGQNNSILFSSQYYKYGFNDMNGIRQSLVYSHGISKKLSIEFQVFTGTGRGKDISDNFQRDYILMTKSNVQNVPTFLKSFNEYFDGIYSYKRISESLKQDNGWGISVNYSFIDAKKWSLNLSLGYLVYNTKSIAKYSDIHLKVSLPTEPQVTDYSIIFPSSIYLNYKDGAPFLKLNTNYNIKKRWKFGVSSNINYSLWGTGLDLGLGLGLCYQLNAE